VTGLGS